MRRRTVTLQDLADAPMRRGAHLGSGGAATTCIVTVQRRYGITHTYCLKEFSGDDSRETLLRELSVLSRLKHPAIAMLHDYVPAGTLLDDGTPLAHPCLLFELVEGITLRELLNAGSKHRLSAEQIIEIGLALADACAYAHSFVVHRDISASNVMLSCAGAVKLLDFGIASVVRAPNEPRTKTVCGKPGYMSPEQASGDRPVDGRSDLFSLGVLLYELACGERPFDGKTDSETFYRTEHGLHVPLAQRAPQTPSALCVIVEQLLQREPLDRFQSARALFDALDTIAPVRATRYDLARIAIEVRADLRPTSQIELPHETPTVPARRPESDERNEPEPVSAFRLRRHRGPAVVLGTATLAAVAALVLSARSVESRPSDTTTSQRAVATTVAATPAETVASPSTPAGAGESDDVDHDRPSAPIGEPTSNTDAVAEEAAVGEKRPALPPNRGRAQAHDVVLATLTIGVRPPSLVWVDSKQIGWSPRTIKRPAGSYTIGTGDARPEITQLVELQPGEQRNVTLRR
jgi:serine/threonine protein kinase